MSESYKEWRYSCPNDECSNHVKAEPVPNTVLCGICGTEMVIYTTEKGK